MKNFLLKKTDLDQKINFTKTFPFFGTSIDLHKSICRGTSTLFCFQNETTWYVDFFMFPIGLVILSIERQKI